jgi:hypothetical protein
MASEYSRQPVRILDFRAASTAGLAPERMPKIFVSDRKRDRTRMRRWQLMLVLVIAARGLLSTGTPATTRRGHTWDSRMFGSIFKLVPDWGRLFVPAHSQGKEPAKILVYETK